MSGATFGQHVRHTLEFFLCLFDAKNDGRINYDNRKHDTIIESDRKLAASLIDTINQFLAEQNEDFLISFEANYTLKDGAMKNVK